MPIIIDEMKNGWTERIKELEDENKRLQKMNPCGHTGFESAPCDICGYPDPRKLIAKLKAENKRLREALKYIAFTTPGPTMKTHSEAADQALKEATHEST